MPWMTDLFYDPALVGAPLGSFQNRPLHQITLPGTHDSGCYRDQRISNVYSATQTQDIFQQLAGGVRYFDLRPCSRGIEFWTYHGQFYWGGQLTGADGILQQIADYFESLAPTDRELVIVNMSHFYQFTNLLHANFVAAIRAALDDYLVEYTQTNIDLCNCPYWQLLSTPPIANGPPPGAIAGAVLQSRVLILYDGALDTPQEAYVTGLPFTAPPNGIPGFFVVAPKYAAPANPIELFDQYSNLGRVEDGYVLSGIRTDQLNKLRNRQNFAYSTQPFSPGNWTPNAVGGVAGALHLLSWTLTPQFSLTITGTWDPLEAAQLYANPLLLNLFCGPNRGWAGFCYSAAADPQINIIYVDDYASTKHQNAASPWNGMAIPVAIAARMNVGPVGQANTW
ncbi:MAG: hypothetical protein V4858_03740 [Pseudomonadota bacterium]